ncbi:MAG: GNAT family N-acetyltransferase [Anaerolineae bacterium]|jgi:ADP-ribose pyrophosphatase YjhB (NUDIX family)/ribosomal protein S18 acetylase RimI-like enzyme|nr:GNAT family N-acetyltransferase [Anaerolineae bacterium]
MPKKLTFCPICGNTLTTREEGGRVRPACDNCGYVHYVNPVPGVGLLIEMNGGVVLIQRGNPPHKGEWTLPSGFVEADESAEEAAIREAEEETGLKVEIVELMGINSFPEGPPVSGIMIFYRLKPIGGELRAGDDAAGVRVFMPDDMPMLPFRTHREIMAEWLEKHQRGVLLDEASRHNPPPEFIIRPFEMDDMEHVIGLLALIPANRNLTSDQWALVVFRLRESRTVEVFVAQTQTAPKMIVGCVALSVVRGLTESRGFIDDMAVLPTYQRRGIGAELLEAVFRRAGQLGLSSLMVNTQRANDQARAFYARLGVADAGIMLVKMK